MNILLTPMGLRAGKRLIPCSLGRGGISAHKREGDGATPAGILHIAELWYRPDRLAAPARAAVAAPPVTSAALPRPWSQ
mgnify:CR=1 FL=1